MTSGRATRDQRAAKVAAARAAAKKSEDRRRNAIVAGAVVAVLVVVVVVFALIQAQRAGTDSASGSGVPAGTTGTANQSVVVGQASAPVTVTLYEDFQCPACKSFEDTTGPTLKALVDKGSVKAEYRPIAFLDGASSTRYSSRALNAAACLVNTAPDKFAAFHELLFANQPAEGSAGLPDSKLLELAKQAGADGLTSCVENETYKGWVSRVTDQSSKDKVTTTPTVLVNGTTLEDRTPAGLTAAVEAAVKS